MLLAGGVPQIAKADGDAPVQAYIAAMPEWKRDVGRRIDELIVRHYPGVKGRAVEHAFLRYRRPRLVPRLSYLHEVRQGDHLPRHVASTVPPGGEGKEARWIDIHEDDLDDEQMSAWIREAATLPGWGKS